jgi:hypothetical protein
MAGAGGVVVDGSVEDDTELTPDELAQFDEMQAADQVEGGGEGETGGAPEGEGNGGVQQIERAADAGDEDDEDDEGAGPDQGAQGDQGREHKPRRVSIKKFERVDGERAGLAKQLETRNAEFTRLEERLRIINEALTAKPQQQEQQQDEDPEPDPEQDIFGHNKWLKRQNDSLRGEITEIRNSLQATADFNSMKESFASEAQYYARTEPNFFQAYNYLMANRMAELAMYYYGKDLTEEGAGLTPDEFRRVERAIAEEERELVGGAFKAKQSPSARIFALAKARGYRPAAPNGDGKEQTNGNGNGNGNGKQVAQRERAPGNLADSATGDDQGGGRQPQRGSVKDEVRRMARGVEAAATLSDGGGAGPQPLNLKRLLEMDEDEFGEFVDGMTPGQERQVFGS